MLRRFFEWNIVVARAINKRLPAPLRTDGNYWFQANVLRGGFEHGEVVFDLGGGSRPWLSIEEKRRLDLTIVGVDISGQELRAAPTGSYDEIIEADISEFSSPRGADKVICQATLEHVHNVAGALDGIARALNKDGTVYIFCPCRNALFAWLNRNLPQDMKKKLLGTLWPYTAEGHDGFEAPYDRCTPSEITKLLKESGLSIISIKTFWVSGYFYVFLPAYIFWRCYQALSWIVLHEDACETFCIVARKGS